MKMKINLMN